MLTNNERKVLRLLLASPLEHFSVNQIARMCKLSPNGAYKILKKFELEGILNPVSIANIISYKLDFENPKTQRVLELALSPKQLSSRIKQRMEDLKPLKAAALACILFGSYATAKTLPNDLDVLFILDRKNYEKYSKLLNEIRAICPTKIHDVIQTKADFSTSIKDKNAAVISTVKEGIILWGEEIIVEVVKNFYQK